MDQERYIQKMDIAAFHVKATKLHFQGLEIPFALHQPVEEETINRSLKKDFV